jgi:hypothetical protein
MKPTLIVLAFISLAGLAIVLVRLVPARASSNPVVEPVRAGTCVDRYNSLLKNAKTALIAGDRATTLNLLEQAKHMIPTCPALQDGVSPETVLLTLNTGIGASAREPEIRPVVFVVTLAHNRKPVEGSPEVLLLTKRAWNRTGCRWP